MKIIFDNDEEKEKFFKAAGAGCHDEFSSMNCNKYKSCSECWADNVSYEIALHDPVKTRDGLLESIAYKFRDMGIPAHIVNIEPGCVERNVWGKIEKGRKLCRDCSATYDFHCPCTATKRMSFHIKKEVSDDQ